ncbi:MAG: hypothetical protein HY290_14140 [Planctomycetia bacterium]|nr:hypothetical protein [Planctomycetia bacterium]
MFNFGKFRKKRDSREFWAWLSANASRISAAGPEGAAHAAAELSRVFKSSYPDLVWEVTPNDSGPWTFCVSADGNPGLFDAVKSAVSDAPSIPGWEIRAFRQRGSLDAVIEMHGRKLSYDDIWCEVERDGDRARVKLLVRGLTLESAKDLLGAALVLLDNAIGEYDSVVKISELDNGPLPSAPVRSDKCFPLSELPGYLDSLEATAT